MNILVLGATGFLGTNLALKLKSYCTAETHITLVDRNWKEQRTIFDVNFDSYTFIEEDIKLETDFDKLLKDQDIIFHLLSSSVPTTSNTGISNELELNVVLTSKILDACIGNNIKKVVFLSSGGTVYGLENDCPLKEETPTYPISSYGLQKITIEKLLYLYNYIYGLDYRIIRLSNPYGPYQKPNGLLGVVTTFVYKALHNEILTVYGNGTVIRDFIYVDDAITGILNISFTSKNHKIYNLGCGYGTSVNQVIDCIKQVINQNLQVEYISGRKVDVPVNYLDISRYTHEFGVPSNVSLEQGIKLTASFLANKEW